MTYSVLLWVHLLGIALGGAAAFGHPVLGMVRGRVPAAGPVLGQVAEGLGKLGSAGLGLLIVSGAGLVWMYHDIGQMPGAFWVKMALVVALIVHITLAKRTAALADAGDAAAEARMPIFAVIGVALMLLLLAAAVWAFR